MDPLNLSPVLLMAYQKHMWLPKASVDIYLPSLWVTLYLGHFFSLGRFEYLAQYYMATQKPLILGHLPFHDLHAHLHRVPAASCHCPWAVELVKAISQDSQRSLAKVLFTCVSVAPTTLASPFQAKTNHFP